jgi:hypothetical protein
MGVALGVAAVGWPRGARAEVVIEKPVIPPLTSFIDPEGIFSMQVHTPLLY